jgi:hypothetical protein
LLNSAAFKQLLIVFNYTVTSYPCVILPVASRIEILAAAFRLFSRALTTQLIKIIRDGRVARSFKDHLEKPFAFQMMKES